VTAGLRRTSCGRCWSTDSLGFGPRLHTRVQLRGNEEGDSKVARRARAYGVDLEVKIKMAEVKKALESLGKKLCAGNQSNLLVWVIPNTLACAHRPLRYHPEFCGSGLELPIEATSAVLQWVEQVKTCGIRGIICLMHPKELRHYAKLNFGASDLLNLYEKAGFTVRHLPWEDPRHRPVTDLRSFRDELIQIRDEALTAFDSLPKPVLLHCSAGQDRSAPVAAYIFARRKGH